MSNRPIQEILNNLKGVVQNSEVKWMALCPCHNDTIQSLSITKEDGKILTYCHAGCDQNEVYNTVVKGQRYDQVTMTSTARIDATTTETEAPVKETESLSVSVSGSDNVTTNGKAKVKAKSKKTIASIYKYQYADVTEAFEKVRYNPKGFLCRKKNSNGNGYIYGIDDITIKPIYNLPNVNKSGLVFVVEGERDADTVNDKLGFVATTNFEGASGKGVKSKWKDEYSEPLKGKDVIILPDNDGPGQAHALAVAKSVCKVAKSVKILNLPDLSEKGDVTDWVEAGGNAAKLKELVAATAEYKPEREPEPRSDNDSNPDTIRLTDLGNAQRLVNKHSDKLQHDIIKGSFLAWDGKKWDAAQGNVCAERLAAETIKGMYKEAAEIKSDDERRELIKHAYKSESEPRIRGMVKLARNIEGMTCTTDEFDQDLFLFNCANGTINLKTGELKPHDPNDKITKMSPVSHDPDAKSKIFEDFLQVVTQGDEELQTYLQRIAGYILTGATTEEKMFFFFGPTGSGKSCFVELMRTVLGEYSQIADFETFVKKKGDSGARNDIARMEGMRGVFSIEVEEGQKIAEGLVKTLTGGDSIAARMLYSEYREFDPQCKLVLVGNDRPIIKDTDDAMWRRWETVPFSYTIPKKDRDPAVKEAFKSVEAVGAAVLAWAVRGCLAWQKEGLNAPSCVTEANAAYQEAMNPLAEFMETEVVFAPKYMITVSEMRQAYATWAADQGQKYSVGPREFNKRLEALGCVRTVLRDGKTRKIWKGVTLAKGSLSSDAIIKAREYGTFLYDKR